MALINTADRLYAGSSLVSRAYQGTARVWPQFMPTDLSGCVIWLDASQLNLANGAVVSSWTNLGSGPSPAIFGSPAPTFRTQALNGKPVVRTTNGQGQYRWTSTGIDKDYTIIFVARRWGLRNGRLLSANYSVATNPNVLWGFHGTEFDSSYTEGWFNTPGAVGGVTATTQWRLYSGDSTSAAIARLFSNGVQIGVSPSIPAKGFAGTLCMGGFDDAGTQTPDAEYAEVAIYNRKLSDAERQQVENYMRTKWNPIAIPFTPPDLGSNLLGWFDGWDGNSVQLAGSGVNNWVNKSGSTMTLSQATDANRPTYANRTVTFIDPQVFGATNSPATFDMAWVGRPRGSGTGNWRTLLRSPVVAHQIIVENGSTRLGTYNGGFFPAGTLTWDNVYGIGFARITDTAPITMSRDGSAMSAVGTTIAAGGAAIGAPPGGFGGYGGPPPSQGWGDILEVMFTTYNLQDNIRQTLEGYLAWRWSMVNLLPAGHPYKSVRP